MSRDDILQNQPLGIFNLRVIIESRAAQSFPVKTRRTTQSFLAREHSMTLKRFIEREKIISDHARPDYERPASVPVINRNQERQRPDEMRCDVKQSLALSQRLANETQLAMLKIAQPAVNQPC